MKKEPSDKEYFSYDGMHCSVLWRTTSDEWRCPVCQRNKREILQWGRRYGANAIRYGNIGWKAALHVHHDHSDVYRFENTLLCGGCNYLDARLKKHVSAKEEYSFSPDEMRQCVISAKSNESLKNADINFERALEIYTINCLLPKDQ